MSAQCMFVRIKMKIRLHAHADVQACFDLKWQSDDCVFTTFHVASFLMYIIQFVHLERSAGLKVVGNKQNF